MPSPSLGNIMCFFFDLGVKVRYYLNVTPSSDPYQLHRDDGPDHRLLSSPPNHVKIPPIHVPQRHPNRRLRPHNSVCSASNRLPGIRREHPIQPHHLRKYSRLHVDCVCNMVSAWLLVWFAFSLWDSAYILYIWGFLSIYPLINDLVGLVWVRYSIGRFHKFTME